MLNESFLGEMRLCLEIWANSGYCSFGGGTKCSECATLYMLWKLSTGEVLHGKMKRLSLEDWREKIGGISTTRKAARIKYNGNFIVVDTFYEKGPEKTSGKKFNIEVTDISATGIKFITDRILGADECFYINFHLPDEIIKICCKVVRIADITEKLAYGAKFINLEPENEEKIKKYIDALISPIKE